MTGTPIEVWENLTSMTVLKKALLPDSGGPGKYRGGLGQEIVLRNDSTHPLTVSCFAGRTEFPPLGMHGGKSGRLREYRINGNVVHPKGRYILKPGEILRTIEAGGGGFGNPFERSIEKVLEDVKQGFVTIEGALRDYGKEVNLDRFTAEQA